MSKRISRRDLLKKSAVVAGAAAAAGIVRGPYILAAGSTEKLRCAVIGAGGMGGYSTDSALGETLVAFADADDNKVAEVMKKVGNRTAPKAFNDYRKMLDECHKDIDVVLIATPDHNHAPAAIRAINLGKHTFCQKPLAHNIYECRTLAKAAKEHNVFTQMGNQGHCGEGYRRLCEYIWAGAIGDVVETHSIFDRSFGGRGPRPKSKPVPAGLHWDEWLGPAPYREYHDGLHPFSWRSWRAFGTGTLGDMACHVLDGIFWSLKLGEAKSYSIECLAQRNGDAEMFAQDNVLRFDFPARGELVPVKCFTYDNKGQKSQVIKDVEKMAGREITEGTIYVGTKGYMYTGTYGDGVRIIPEEKHKAFPVPEKSIPRVSGGPIADLFRAIRGGSKPCSNFTDYAGPFAEFVLSGQLGMFAGVGRKVEYNSVDMKCNIPELNQYIKREYRKGWEV